MSPKNVLFVLSGIWDLGNGRGMSAVHRTLLAADEKFGAVIITPDPYVLAADYPNSTLIRLWSISANFKNRYLNYIVARLAYALGCIQTIFWGMFYHKRIGLIYTNTYIPATFFIQNILRIKSIHRAYGTFLSPDKPAILDIAKYEEIFLFLFPASAYIITNDGTKGDLVAKRYGVAPESLFFWRNGVDLDKCNKKNWRAILNLPATTTLFCSTCRLTGWKRVDRIIRAFERCERRDIALAIAGDGDEFYNLKRLANNDNRIYFLGAISNIDASTLISSADAYISLHEVSNVGNPLLEALYSGCPIITCNSGDTGSVINGRNGLIFDSSNEDLLISNVAEAINLIANSPSLRKQLSAAEKTWAHNNLVSWNKRIENEISLISALTSNRPQ